MQAKCSIAKLRHSIRFFFTEKQKVCKTNGVPSRKYIGNSDDSLMLP